MEGIPLQGPLSGVRIIEISGLGPSPYGTMLLADLGADVIRVDRISTVQSGYSVDASMLGVSRNRRSLAVDLKSVDGLEILLDLIESADVLVEGFRPGVAERLGFGPSVSLERNPGLIFARVTGWGQDGPLSLRAGHDLNYASVAGAVHPIGEPDRPPPPPLSFLADLGGGGTFLAIGVCAALLHRQQSGTGQVIDVAMVDGTASLTALFHGLMRVGRWSPDRGSNIADGGAPFYATYECADGEYIAVGALEPQFYAALLDGLGLHHDEYPQEQRSEWPRYREIFAATFRSKTRDDWTRLFADVDACVSPVLSLAEAPHHPQAIARQAFIAADGGFEPAPTPRFSATPATARLPAPQHGQHSDEVLRELGYDESRRERLFESGVVA